MPIEAVVVMMTCSVLQVIGLFCLTVGVHRMTRNPKPIYRSNAEAARFKPRVFGQNREM